MANVLVQQSTMAAIASAIRDKANTSETFKPSQMATAIADISTGINPDRLEAVYMEKTLTDLPYDFRYGSSVVLNNEIHILGSSVDSYKKYHYKWNGSSWVSVSTLPYYFYDGAAVVLNNEIHILGGAQYPQIHYKWNGSSWVSVSTLPYNFNGGAAVVFNNEIHIMGSSTNASTSILFYKFNGSSWEKLTNLPNNFSYGSALVYNNKIHILGSGYSTNSFKMYQVWDGSDWDWAGVILPYEFYRGAAVVIDDEIHILGSGYSASYYKNHYKLNGNTWVKLEDLPYEFYGGSAVIYNEAIRLMGGSNNTRKNYSIYEKLYNLLPVIHLTITSEPGATITYSANGKSKSFTYTEEKTVELDSLGTYTVTASLNGQESTKTVNVTERKDYSVDLPALSLTIISEAGNTITWSDGINTGEFVSTGSDVIKSFVLGIWQIDAVNDDGEEKSKTINIGSYGEYTIRVKLVGPYLAPFSEATDEEIVEALTKYYNNELSIDDIKTVWNVGDSRTVSLSAMAATGVEESHNAQTVEFAIIDFEHDNLATAVNGHTKSLLTIQMKDCLDVGGYMNSKLNNYAYGKYSTSARRTWINNIFEKALPTWLQTNLKPVTKQTYEGISSGYASLVSSTERCFMISNYELFGSEYSPFLPSSDGDQYEYYKTVTNKKKSINGSICRWFTRSAFWNADNNYSYFIYCELSGGRGDGSYTDVKLGIAIALAL